MDIKKIIISIIIGYALGMISGGYFISKFVFKDDIRNYGSHNTGATNMQRTYGNKYGFITLFIDVLKGYLSVFLVNKLFGNNYGPIAGLAAVFGHNYPFYLKFKGGKGLACTTGVLIAMTPKLLLILLVIFILTVLISKYVSLGAIVVSIVAPILSYFSKLYNGKIEFYTIIILALWIIIRHHQNIDRLIKGNENKLSFSKKRGNK